MFDKIIPSTPITSSRYSEIDNTFFVEYDLLYSPFEPPEKIERLFDIKHFPNHVPFQLLDEQVRVGEEVMVWLKDEACLLANGWMPHRNSSLKSAASLFIIGRTKRKLLGKAIQCRVGITANFEPIVYQEDGFRFSKDEIKAIARLDHATKFKDVELNTQYGTLFFEKKNRRVVLPDGNIIQEKYLMHLKRLIREAGV